jgi:hypothetical protein
MRISSRYLISVVALMACFTIALSQTQPDQVIEFFREGARGPSNSYDSSWSYDEWNSLTAAGTRQQFILGKAMQKKYPKIFTATYDPDNIYVLANYLYLAVQSAAAHLQGLFHGVGLKFRTGYPVSTAVPPFEGYNMQTLIDKLPNDAAIPDFMEPAILNVIDSWSYVIFERMFGSSLCPNAATWAAANMKDAAYTAAWNTFKPTIDKANTYLGTKMTSGSNVITFVDTVLVDLYDNRTMPGKMDAALVPNLTYAYTWFVYHQEYAQLVQRQVSAYYPVTEILSQLAYFKRGSSLAYKACLYSGHSYNMMALLAAFNIINEDCIMANFNAHVAKKTIPYPACTLPVFASNFVVEMYNTTSPTVKVLYNNQPISLCNGQTTCTYDQFLTVANNAMGALTSTTHKSKCGRS